MERRIAFQCVPSELFLEENGNSAKSSRTYKPQRWYETRINGVRLRAGEKYCTQHRKVPQAPKTTPEAHRDPSTPVAAVPVVSVRALHSRKMKYLTSWLTNLKESTMQSTHQTSTSVDFGSSPRPARRQEVWGLARG